VAWRKTDPGVLRKNDTREKHSKEQRLHRFEENRLKGNISRKALNENNLSLPTPGGWWTINLNSNLGGANPASSLNQEDSKLILPDSGTTEGGLM